MQITGLKNINFMGRTKFLSCDESGNYKKIAEYQYGSRSFGETKGLSEFVLKHSYPFAGVEETIGKDHNDATYKVYIADPNEKVSDFLKRSHDYIVYDLEPTFPDARKDYYSNDSCTIDKEFQTALDYYKRLESTACKSTDEEFAKSKQILINNCKEIFDESAALRKERSDLISKINNKATMVELIKLNVEDFSKKLNVKKNTIQLHRRSYDAKVKKLNNWLEKKATLSAEPSAKQEVVDKVNEKIKYFTDAVEAMAMRVNNYEFKIQYWENYINDAPKKIAKCNDDIAKFKLRLTEIENALKPKFEKLCRFYTVNGIKIIKRV